MNTSSLTLLLFLSLSSTFLGSVVSHGVPCPTTVQHGDLPPPPAVSTSHPLHPHIHPHQEYHPSPSPHASATPHTPSPSPSNPIDAVVTSVSEAITSFQSTPFDDSLKAVCGKAPHPEICVTSIQAVSPGLSSVDMRIALSQGLKAIVADVAILYAKAQALPDSLKAESTVPAPPTDDPGLAGNPNPLNACIRGLSEAHKDAQDALMYLQENSPASAKSNIDAFSNSITLCTERTNPITADAEKIYQMLQNCGAFYDILWPEASHDFLFPGQGH